MLVSEGDNDHFKDQLPRVSLHLISEVEHEYGYSILKLYEGCKICTLK